MSAKFLGGDAKSLQQRTNLQLTNTGQGSIVIGRFDFTGDGMGIPYNTLRAAKARMAKN